MEELIEKWEDKLARWMAEYDFHVLGKDIPAAKLMKAKILVLQDCIAELKDSNYEKNIR
jgi:hypothetical protein